MGYSNAELEQEIKGGEGEKGDQGIPGIGFQLTDDGNFDIDERRLTDVAKPVHDNDATTKKYVDDNLNKKLNITMTRNLDLNDNKIVNLADSTGDGDAVNLSQLKAYTQFGQNNYHLQKSFRFYKDFGDKSGLTIQSPPNTAPNHYFQNHINHNDAYIIEKEGFDDGFGRQAWSSIKMTNDRLPSGIYTSIFETFPIVQAGGFRVDDTIIFNINGDSHYKINTFDSDKIDNQYTISIIQFTSDGGAGEITFQIRYCGSQYDKNIRFLFYSRAIKGKQSTSFNHNIFNVSDIDDNHEILYFENITMNGNKIESLADPTDNGDATNKGYVDTENAKQDIAIADKASKSYVLNEIAKIPTSDTSSFLKLDGSRAMTGALDMDDQKIVKLDTLTDHKIDDALEIRRKDLKSAVNEEYLNGDYFDLKQRPIRNTTPYSINAFTRDTDIVSKKYVDQKISDDIAAIPQTDTSDLLKFDGSRKMTGDLDMNSKTIENVNAIYLTNTSRINTNSGYIYNLGDPTLAGYAANRQYVDDEIAKIPTIDTSDLLKLDGSRAMTGNLQMNGNKIIKLKTQQVMIQMHERWLLIKVMLTEQ